MSDSGKAEIIFDEVFKHAGILLSSEGQSKLGLILLLTAIKFGVEKTELTAYAPPIGGRGVKKQKKLYTQGGVN